MSDHQVYQYGSRFQTLVAAMMLREPEFLAHYRDVLKVKYFEFEAHQVVAHAILKYFDKFKSAPSVGILVELLREHCRKNGMEKEERLPINEMLKRAVKMPIRDTEFVKESVIRFGQRQALREGVIKVVELLEKDEHLDDARSIIENSLQAGVTSDLGLDLFADLSKIKTLLKQESQENGPRRKVPTLLRSIDRRLKGGLGIGEIGVFMGSPGRGKSIMLVQCGAGAISSQKKVMHFTLGDLSEIDVAIRYLSRFTGIPEEKLLAEDGAKFERRMERYITNNPNLGIKYLNPGQNTVQTLRSYISRVQSVKEWHPDLVIVDYADKLIDSRGQVRGGREFRSDEQLGNIYDDLISMGRDFKCGVWTASQIKVDFFDADVVDIDAASGAWLKMANADIVIPICQTRNEAARNRARLFGAKVRRGEDKWFVPIVFDKPRMLVRELDPSEMVLRKKVS